MTMEQISNKTVKISAENQPLLKISTKTQKLEGTKVSFMNPNAPEHLGPRTNTILKKQPNNQLPSSNEPGANNLSRFSQNPNYKTPNSK